MGLRFAINFLGIPAACRNSQGVSLVKDAFSASGPVLRTLRRLEFGNLPALHNYTYAGDCDRPAPPTPLCEQPCKFQIWNHKDLTSFLRSSDTFDLEVQLTSKGREHSGFRGQARTHSTACHEAFWYPEFLN
ncbi:MAG: hypothetical protein DMG21_01540 [Acidobacteria bacterium]|nr:MAG: hypothetical protein DMG21_01540 [Acidobacteriota bacterium]